VATALRLLLLAQALPARVAVAGQIADRKAHLKLARQADRAAAAKAVMAIQAAATLARRAPSIQDQAAVQAAVMPLLVNQAVRAVQVCTSFVTLGHNAQRAARLHHRAAIRSIRSRLQGCTEHDVFCKNL
jgi:hypothetical protein